MRKAFIFLIMSFLCFLVASGIYMESGLTPANHTYMHIPVWKQTHDNTYYIYRGSAMFQVTTNQFDKE